MIAAMDITPTYSGCPAMEVIEHDVTEAVRAAGFEQVTVRRVLSPAWTTDWMSAEGRRKLEDYGIAPPGASHHDPAGGPVAGGWGAGRSGTRSATLNRYVPWFEP